MGLESGKLQIRSITTSSCSGERILSLVLILVCHHLKRFSYCLSQPSEWLGVCTLHPLSPLIASEVAGAPLIFRLGLWTLRGSRD